MRSKDKAHRTSIARGRLERKAGAGQTFSRPWRSGRRCKRSAAGHFSGPGSESRPGRKALPKDGFAGAPRARRPELPRKPVTTRSGPAATFHCFEFRGLPTILRRSRPAGRRHCTSGEWLTEVERVIAL